MTSATAPHDAETFTDVLVSVDDGTLRQIDRFAEEMGLDRSSAVVFLAMRSLGQYLYKKRFGEHPPNGLVALEALVRAEDETYVEPSPALVESLRG